MHVRVYASRRVRLYDYEDSLKGNCVFKQLLRGPLVYQYFCGSPDLYLSLHGQPGQLLRVDLLKKIEIIASLSTRNC